MNMGMAKTVFNHTIHYMRSYFVGVIATLRSLQQKKKSIHFTVSEIGLFVTSSHSWNFRPIMHRNRNFISYKLVLSKTLIS